MSAERPNMLFYDSEKNADFRKALVDFTKQAYSAIYENSQDTLHHEAATGGLLVASIDLEAEGERRDYSIYSEKDDPWVEVCSISYTNIGRLTNQAAQLIHEDMRVSAARHRGVVYDTEEVKRAQVEVFTRRAFFVQLDTGSVSTETDFGYVVDTMEVRRVSSRTSSDDFETKYKKLFDEGDVREFTRAFVELKLIDNDYVNCFLGRL